MQNIPCLYLIFTCILLQGRHIVIFLHTNILYRRSTLRFYNAHEKCTDAINLYQQKNPVENIHGIFYYFCKCYFFTPLMPYFTPLASIVTSPNLLMLLTAFCLSACASTAAVAVAS